MKQCKELKSRMESFCQRESSGPIISREEGCVLMSNFEAEVLSFLLKCKGWYLGGGGSSEYVICRKTTLLAHFPAIWESCYGLFCKTLKTSPIIFLKFPKFVPIKLSEGEMYLTDVF